MVLFNGLTKVGSFSQPQQLQNQFSPYSSPFIQYIVCPLLYITFHLRHFLNLAHYYFFSLYFCLLHRRHISFKLIDFHFKKNYFSSEEHSNRYQMSTHFLLRAKERGSTCISLLSQVSIFFFK